jgi:hypothetical protein
MYRLKLLCQGSWQSVVVRIRHSTDEQQRGVRTAAGLPCPCQTADKRAQLSASCEGEMQAAAAAAAAGSTTHINTRYLMYSEKGRSCYYYAR